MVHLVEHPIVQHTLAELRDERTGPERFRQLAGRMGALLAADALRDVPLREVVVDTPLGPARARVFARQVVLVPVLRAGLGMLTGVLEVVPDARVGYLGLQRDERTAVASQYYAKLPHDLDRSCVLMIDPMLATGGSAVAALEVLTRAGARDVRLACIVAAPEGVAAVEAAFPRVPIYTPAVDERLNEAKFIVPGLGDFGDRLYGTR